MNKTNSDIFFNTRDELTKVCLDDVMYVVSDGSRSLGICFVC